MLRWLLLLLYHSWKTSVRLGNILIRRNQIRRRNCMIICILNCKNGRKISEFSKKIFRIAFLFNRKFWIFFVPNYFFSRFGVSFFKFWIFNQKIQILKKKTFKIWKKKQFLENFQNSRLNRKKMLFGRFFQILRFSPKFQTFSAFTFSRKHLFFKNSIFTI